MESRTGWKWYGYAGHLCVGKRCAYHLCTRVGGFLVSTVGHYLPRDSDKMKTIGADSESFFETFVFRCSGEDEHGDPVVDNQEIDSERYAKSIDAERGHYRFCEKYAGGCHRQA
jgi:hypothetical protein